MKNVVYIRRLPLGEGMPKICIPVMGSDGEQLLMSAEEALPHKPDLVEWRADFFREICRTEAVLCALKRLRGLLGELPLLFTFRTKREGGEQELAEEEYIKLYEAVLDSGLIDAADVELFLQEQTVRSVLEKAREKQVKVIMSSHDFAETPPRGELLKRLERMQELGADVAKIAVMPNSSADVLALLSASEEAARSLAVPVITMSMGGRGMVSRLMGECFGSALTFGMAGRASAPGQIPAKELRLILEKIHQYS